MQISGVLFLVSVSPIHCPTNLSSLGIPELQSLSSHPFIYLFIYFRAAPAAYGDSQARGRIRAVAAGLYHSHSNSGSEPRL